MLHVKYCALSVAYCMFHAYCCALYVIGRSKLCTVITYTCCNRLHSKHEHKANALEVRA